MSDELDGALSNLDAETRARIAEAGVAAMQAEVERVFSEQQAHRVNQARAAEEKRKHDKWSELERAKAEEEAQAPRGRAGDGTRWKIAQKYAALKAEALNPREAKAPKIEIPENASRKEMMEAYRAAVAKVRRGDLHAISEIQRNFRKRGLEI